MANNFQVYAQYYNLLYKDKNYEKEVDYIVSQIEKYAPSSKTILEFGCGTGGHGLLLQNRGYKILGLERSEAMVEEATRNGLACKVADISNFDLQKQYDAVISLFHVISYLTDNNSLVATFLNAAQHLKTGGIFLFDVWYSPAVYHLKALPRIKQMQNHELAVTRFADPVPDVNKNIIEVHFTVFAKDLVSGEQSNLNESHPMRHFSIPEIALLASLSGFEMINSEEFLTGNTPSENTWGVCFILKKIK